MEQSLESAAGSVRLVVRQIQLREAGHRGQVAPVFGKRLLETFACRDHVEAQQRDAATQMIGQRLSGLFRGQRVHRHQRRTELVAPQPCADQGQVGGRTLGVRFSNGLQVAKCCVALAPGQQGQGLGRADGGVVRFDLGGSGKTGIGILDIAIHQVGLGRQHQGVAILRSRCYQWRQHAKCLVGLPATEIDHRQLVARFGRVRRGQHRLLQQGFGMRQRIELYRSLAGE